LGLNGVFSRRREADTFPFCRSTAVSEIDLPPLRRRSLLPVQSHQPPAMSEAEIAAVASRNGFPPVPAPNDDNAAILRRQRQPTGRDHQFNVRLRRETVDFIYSQANSRNVPIAQIIEEMVEALKRQQGRE